MIFNFTKDAETLGGHGAEEYALLERLYAMGVGSDGVYHTRITSELTLDTLLGRNVVTFFSNWTDETNFPFRYGSGVIIPTADVAYRMIFYKSVSGKAFSTALAKYSNGAWSIDWDTTFNGTASGNLPLTGGRINGADYFPLELNGVSSNQEVYLKMLSNGIVLGSLGFYGVDSPRFVSTGGVASVLLHSHNFSTYALPLDGNTPLEGNTLGISQNRGSVNADDAHVGLKTHTTKGDTENYRYLVVLNASQYGTADIGSAIFLRDCVNGAQTNYTLHHDGNSAKVVISETAPSDTSALWVY